jgi:hypothetical protein
LNYSCGEALQWTSQTLTQNGLRVIQTFDLNTARHTLEDCSCPHHGTSECDCQMVVLLVYGETGGPVTLILHGYVQFGDNKTFAIKVTNNGDGVLRFNEKPYIEVLEGC